MKRLLLTICFCLLISVSFADTEILVPTSDDGGWDNGTYAEIDEGSTPNDADLISENGKNQVITGNISNLVTADADDTYNYIILHSRTDMTGTPNDEYVRTVIFDGTDTTTLNGGNNASFTTDSTGQITVHNSFAEINALTFTITAMAIGGETVTLWRCSDMWIEVNYTVVGPAKCSVDCVGNPTVMY